MHELYLASVWLHILAAMAWVGGMIFLVAVIVPMLRRPDTRERASEIMQLAGRRFRTVGWISFAVLVVTGVFNVLHRGFRFEDFFTGDVFLGRWGHALATKLVLVAIVLSMSAVHDFWLGPKAAEGGPEARERFRKIASIMGRVTFAFALAIVAVAVTLVR